MAIAESPGIIWLRIILTMNRKHSVHFYKESCFPQAIKSEIQLLRRFANLQGKILMISLDTANDIKADDFIPEINVTTLN